MKINNLFLQTIRRGHVTLTVVIDIVLLHQPRIVISASTSIQTTMTGNIGEKRLLIRVTKSSEPENERKKEEILPQKNNKKMA